MIRSITSQIMIFCVFDFFYFQYVCFIMILFNSFSVANMVEFNVTCRLKTI